jgi:LCP family protein required for cell wall assembly
MVLSGGLLIGPRLVLASATRNLKQSQLLGDAGAKQEKQHVTVNGAKNILLVGLDNRPFQNPNDLIRSDTIMILHVPSSHDRGYLVSIPRDTYVRIPANKATKYAGGQEKINAAFAFGSTQGGGIKGGVHLLAETIKTQWNITFDAAAVIDFAGFQKVVTALGGVDMCIDEKTTSIHRGKTKDGKQAVPFKINTDGTIAYAIRGVTPEVYEVGCRHLEAWQALDFIRQRDLLANGDLDYGRQRHQQQFLKAVLSEVTSSGTLTNPAKLATAVDLISKSMNVDYGGIAPEDWIYAMRGLRPADLVTIKTNGGQLFGSVINGQDVQQLNPTSLELLAAVKADTVDRFIVAHPDWVAAGA